MLGSWPTPRCRYMYDSIEEKFESLERRIEMFATALAAKEAHNFSSIVALASQEIVFAMGLVFCNGEGHLNDKSIMLEGSVEFSGGQIVRLDLHKLDGFSFFPGQVIGVKGNNPSGHCLVAPRLFDSFPISYPLHLGDSDAPSAKRLAVDRNSKITSLSRTQKSISMLIAAGPFTTTDNLDFEPLIDLLAYARRKQPNLLLLMGPFIYSDHPQIKIGTVDRLFSQIFQEEVSARLQDYCEEMVFDVNIMFDCMDAGLYPCVAQCKLVGTFTKEDGRISISQSSVNAHIRVFPRPYLIYSSKVKTSTILIGDSTSISDYDLLMFGGALTSIQSGKGIEMLGGYLQFSPSERTLRLVQNLRAALDGLLQRKIDEHAATYMWSSS